MVQPPWKWCDSFSKKIKGLPGDSVVMISPANAGGKGSIPGPGRSHMTWSN